MYQLKKILPIMLPSMVEAEEFLKHPLDQMSGKMLYFCDNDLLFSGWEYGKFLQWKLMFFIPLRRFTILISQTRC